MRRFLFLLLLIALVAFGYYRWTLLTGTPGGQRQPEAFTPSQGSKIDLKDVQVLAAIDAEYSKLIGAATPAVVCIRSRGVAPVDPFEILFRRQAGAPLPVKRSLGSGVIVSKEGHILTNAHVIEGMSEIVVQLNDGRLVPARLIGADKQTDIAVLRIAAPRIEPMPLGNSDEVRVGQMVFAIGNPFGLQETVTQGIISAKGRSISESGVEFLQTDAAVNQGNSGGPLINLRGEIIGINSAIYSESGGWLGISFAIPSNTVRRTLESIIKLGRVVRPYLGVLMGDLNDELARQLQAPDAKGALLHDVLPNSPAERAGLKPGDIIRRLNGHAINNSTALRDRIAVMSAGSKVEIVFLRDGKEQTLTVEITEPPAEIPSRQPATPVTPQSSRSGDGPRIEGASGTPALASLQVAEIPEPARARLGAAQDAVAGVLVTATDPNVQGLLVGDVIEEINREPIGSLEDYERVTRSLAASPKVLLHIIRGGTRMYVAIRTPTSIP